MENDPKISFNPDDYFVYRIKNTNEIIVIEKNQEDLTRVKNLLVKWHVLSNIPDIETINVFLTSYNKINNTYDLSGLKKKIKMNELIDSFVIKRTSIEEIIKNVKGK